MPLTTDPRIGQKQMRSDEQLMVQLRKLQKRIKNFSGLVWISERRQWKASIKSNGKSLLLGYYDSEIGAFRAYRAGKALRPQRTDAFESLARIEKLLRLAASCPPEIRQDFSPLGSTLDQNRWRVESYETRLNRFKG